jgi:tryptophan synthase beta chain
LPKKIFPPLAQPLHPGTAKPLGPDDLAPIFPMALIEQEMSPKQRIDISGEEIEKGLESLPKI